MNRHGFYLDRSLHCSTPTSPSVKRDGWIGQSSRSLILNVFSFEIRLHSCQQPLGHSHVISGCSSALRVLWNREFSSMGFSQALHGRDMSPAPLVCAQRKGRSLQEECPVCSARCIYTLGSLCCQGNSWESDIKHKQMCVHTVKTKIK